MEQNAWAEGAIRVPRRLVFIQPICAVPARNTVGRRSLSWFAHTQNWVSMNDAH